MISTKKTQVARKPLRVLMVTGVYPTAQIPHSGTFIKTQVESLRAAGVEVEVLHPPPGPVPLRYLWAALQVFLKTLRGDYDVVNGHYGLWCLAARMQWTTPVVASFLGGDLFGELYADGGSRQKADLVVQISRWLCRHVEAVIVKSEGMKRLVPSPNAFVIANGVDFSLFHPIPRAQAREALAWAQERYYVLFGNNPQLPAKNYPLAQTAISRLREKGLEAELVVANGLPQSEVVKYLNACNALLLSSRYEGSPNIVKEAMACSVPVVATEVGDVSDLIGRTAGCRVCAAEADELASGLEEALRHREPTSGRADIAHLECSLVAQQVIAVFEQAMGRHSKKAKAKLETMHSKVQYQSEEVR